MNQTVARVILVLTKDQQWRNRLAQSLQQKADLVPLFREDIDFSVEGSGTEPNLVLVDADLLPQPGSPSLFQVQRKLANHPFVAVYSPGHLPKLHEVRKSFIAGAQDLVEKPYTLRETLSILKSQELFNRVSSNH